MQDAPTQPLVIDEVRFEELTPGVSLSGPVDGALSGTVRTNPWDIPDSGPFSLEEVLGSTGMVARDWHVSNVVAYTWEPVPNGSQTWIAFELQVAQD